MIDQIQRLDEVQVQVDRFSASLSRARGLGIMTCQGGPGGSCGPGYPCGQGGHSGKVGQGGQGGPDG